MPELPEVARTVLGLRKILVGKDLIDIKIHSGRYKRHGNPSGLDAFLNNLPCRVNSVNFKGKFIYMIVSNPIGNWYVWNTLGMGGSWKKEKSKHGHVEFVTDEGSAFFTDIRNFGTLRFTNSLKEMEQKLETIGPDHLNTEIPDSLFKERLMRRRKATLAEALMDQKLIGGIGNYIKAEILYACRLSPHRTVESLSDADFSNLNRSTLDVVVRSFRNKGVTISTYSGIEGERGDYVFSLKVYGKKTCELGYPVIREETSDKRTTHWVPELQK